MTEAVEPHQKGDVGVLVKHGRPVLVTEGNFQPLSNEDFWNLRESNFVGPSGIEIAGYSVIEIVIADLGSGPTYEFILHCSGVTSFKVPHDFGFPGESIVWDGIWFPIEGESAKIVEAIQAEVSKPPGQLLSLSDIVSILALTNGSHIQATLDIDLQQVISEARLDFQISELAIPPWPYQEIGIRWLFELFHLELGGILGDQMGLGKSVQFIGLLKTALAHGVERALLVVPNLTRLNWLMELEKFYPELSLYVHHGPNREHRFAQLSREKVTLTTYEILVQDVHNFARIDYDLVLCDEAQLLKSPRSKRRAAVSSLNSSRKFLATGTPIENHPLDMWSLVDLAFPGILGNLEYFESLARDDIKAAEKLGASIAPLILRRTSDEVGLDIPPSREIPIALELEGVLADIYEDLRTGHHPATSDQGSLALFGHLRQFCSNPFEYLEREFEIEIPKIEMLVNICREVALLGDKVVIFAHYQSTIDEIHSVLAQQFPKNYISKIDGRDTAESRQLEIESFQSEPRFGVLITNPRAAGMGLNIQTANHVIHYSPDWNPSKEDQATFRVRRPGQTKPVFVYGLIYSDTVEAYMNQLLSTKREIAAAVLGSAEAEGSEKSVSEALRFTPIGKEEN